MRIRDRVEGGGGARTWAAEDVDAKDLVSLCSLMTGEVLFGIDTRKIREVLGRRTVEPVPLAPAYIGGVLPYRGEVLTAVSLRALLGLEPLAGGSCVLVLDGEVEEDRFGLMVDRVGGVVTLERKTLAENPTTLDEVSKAIYSGAYRMDDGLLIELDPGRMHPTRLGETGLFGQVGKGRGLAYGRPGPGQVQGEAR